MSEKQIDNYISEVLNGEALENALAFIAYLRASGVVFGLHDVGWWEGKLYWWLKYKDETVFYVLVYSPASAVDSTEPWVIWSDDSGSNWFENSHLDENIRETAWKNVDVCGNETEIACGGCPSIGGQPKTIFGKVFRNTCGTTFCFKNPNSTELECLKQLLEIRKNDILKNILNP